MLGGVRYYLSELVDLFSFVVLGPSTDLSCTLGVFCYKHYLHKVLTSVSSSSPFKLPESVVDILISKGSFWFAGLLAGLSLFVEERRRRGELAMYVLPKALESSWIMARGKGLVFKTGNYGEMLVSSLVCV
jgi:hypothetical protein